MEKKKLYLIIAAILAVSAIFAGICHDLIDADIQNKELNLGIAERANESSMSISGFQYDYGQKGYGSYQSDRLNYETNQRSYEKRHDKIERQETIRDVLPIIIIVIGIAVSYYFYKRYSKIEPKATEDP